MVRPRLLGLGIGLLLLLMFGAGTLAWPQLLAGKELLPSTPAAAAVEPGPMLGTEFEPLRPGTRFTYREQDGSEFTREVMLPVRIQWFDELEREIIPVHDSRFDLYWFYRNVSGEIQAIGTWDGGQVERWGEYIVLLSPTAAKAGPVQTAAGSFPDVRLMQDHYGNAWYARDVGLVKTDSYELVQVSIHPARQSPIPGVSPSRNE